MFGIYVDIIIVFGNILFVCLNCVIEGFGVIVFVKFEYYNLVLSVKDCIGIVMINVVEVFGELKLGGIIVEFISGNIGIVFVMVGVVWGYCVILMMLVLMLKECCVLFKVFGVEIVFIDFILGMKGVIVEVECIVVEIFGVIWIC